MFRNLPLQVQGTACSSLHDTREQSISHLCNVSVIRANKLSLQELNQLIEIKLLAPGFLDVFGS